MCKCKYALISTLPFYLFFPLKFTENFPHGRSGQLAPTIVAKESRLGIEHVIILLQNLAVFHVLDQQKSWPLVEIQMKNVAVFPAVQVRFDRNDKRKRHM